MRPDQGIAVAAAVPAAPLSWDSIVEPVEPFLGLVREGLAEQVATFDPEIAAYAHYALTNQGKHLRPALVFLSGQAAGVCGPELVQAAVIIEMVHLATLVHDDIMDEATLRRRRPTVAANWGNEISVLLGDCLFAHALKLASKFPTTEVCRAVASATKTVCSGEILQTLRRSRSNLTLAEYFKVIGMKTGELFALSSELGSGLAGANPGEREAMRRYGFQLGTAYQIHDDCLDLFGSESSTGKSLGSDVASGKLTLPVLIGLERSTPAERTQVEGWMRQWDPATHLPHLLEWLEKRQALRETQAHVCAFVTGAHEALEILEPSASRESLARLAAFLLKENRELVDG